MTRWQQLLLTGGGVIIGALILVAPTPTRADGCGWGFTDWRQQVGEGSCSWQQGGYKNANFYFSGSISLPSEVTRIEFFNGSIDDIGEMTANGTMVYHDPSGCQNPGYPTVTLTNPGSTVAMSLHTVDSCGGSTGGTIQFRFYRSTVPPPVITSCTASPNPVALSNGQATTTFTALSSDPGGGAVTRYDWDFGDGTTGVSDAGNSPANQVATTPATDVPPLAQALAPPIARAGGLGPSTPTATATLSANPTSIFAGEPSTLTWSTSGIDRSTFTITASNSIGTRTATIRFPDGSVQIADGPSSGPSVASDSGAPAIRAIRSALRRVGEPDIAHAAGGGGGEPTEPPTIFFTWSGSSAPVPSGSLVTLQWFVSGATSITSNLGDIPSAGSQLVQLSYVTVTSNFLESTPASGSTTVTPTLTTTYTITASDANGPTTATAVVAVNRPPISHTYTSAGSYTVTVTATSSSGNTGTGSCSVAVTGGPPLDPTISSLAASCLDQDVTPTVRLTWVSSASATYAVKRDGATIATTTTASYDDTAVRNATEYTYQISAQGSGATLDGAAQTVTTPTCPELGLTLSPASTTLAPGGTQRFVAAVTVNGRAASAADVTLTWEADAAAGTITASGSADPLAATFTAGSTLGPYPTAVRATIRLGDAVATRTAAVAITATGTSGVFGDVYSGGTVSNLTVDPKSVVSAAGAISGVTGTTFQIPGYTTSNSLAWLDQGGTAGARSLMLAQAQRLRNEQVVRNRQLGTGDVTIRGDFNLNPPDTATNALATRQIAAISRATPEGQVWYVPGNLTIDASSGPVTFYGRGTIIVDGLVTLRGPNAIQYPALQNGSSLSAPPNPVNTASLGVIVTAARGEGVAIESTVTQFVGAYFAAGRPDGSGGTIDFQAASADPKPIFASGLFVGPSIHLGRPIGAIIYDPRVTTLTPPGFGVVTTPGIRETAP